MLLPIRSDYHLPVHSHAARCGIIFPESRFVKETLCGGNRKVPSPSEDSPRPPHPPRRWFPPKLIQPNQTRPTPPAIPPHRRVAPSPFRCFRVSLVGPSSFGLRISDFWSSQRQSDRLPRAVAFQRREDDLMGLDRILQVAVRLPVLPHALDQVIYFGLERVVRHIAGIRRELR